jgi:hypothetical protein
MAAIGSSQNAELNAGIDHLANAGHGNDSSVTLNGGLEADSARWDAMTGQAATTPHSVLSTYAFSRSANGSDGQNFLPNGDYLGSGNGASAATFDQRVMVGMAGGSEA